MSNSCYGFDHDGKFCDVWHLIKQKYPYIKGMKDIASAILNKNNVKQQSTSFRLNSLFAIGWLVVLRIYVALAVHVFQPYRDFEPGDNQSLKLKWRVGETLCRICITFWMTLVYMYLSDRMGDCQECNRQNRSYIKCILTISSKYLFKE